MSRALTLGLCALGLYLSRHISNTQPGPVHWPADAENKAPVTGKKAFFSVNAQCAQKRELPEPASVIRLNKMQLSCDRTCLARSVSENRAKKGTLGAIEKASSERVHRMRFGVVIAAPH